MKKVGLRWATLSLCILALALLGGAGQTAASTTSHCNTPDPSGRLFCVSIEDLDGVSPSGLVGSGKRQVDVEAYQFYKLTITNSGGNTLTNGTVKVVLTDNVTDVGSVNSTAVFTPAGSAPFCSLASQAPNTVTCTLANIPAGVTTPTLVLGYHTSNTANVVSTDANVTVGFKEGSNGTNGANPATLAFTEDTSLEPDPEASLAWSPPGQDGSLGTSPTFDSQFSVLQYKVPAGKPAFVATESEGAGTLCSTGLTCFGEVVTTDLSHADDGTFSRSNLFHLTITMNLDLLPGGNVN